MRIDRSFLVKHVLSDPLTGGGVWDWDYVVVLDDSPSTVAVQETPGASSSWGDTSSYPPTVLR